jgi:hypothetical protein
MLRGMSHAGYRVILLAVWFSVALVALLIATSASVSAHPQGMHYGAAMSEGHSTGEYSLEAETCCHKTGTCVVQFLQLVPATVPLDGSLSQLERTFAVSWHASISSATDPPPPRL